MGFEIHIFKEFVVHLIVKWNIPVIVATELYTYHWYMIPVYCCFLYYVLHLIHLNCISQWNIIPTSLNSWWVNNGFHWHINVRQYSISIYHHRTSSFSTIFLYSSKPPSKQYTFPFEHTHSSLHIIRINRSSWLTRTTPPYNKENAKYTTGSFSRK